MMKMISKSLQHYVDKLRSNEKFSFTRWGDGEWGCAFGAKGANCDNHKYFPKMSSDLIKALKHDKHYIKASWPLSVPMFSAIHPRITEFIKNQHIEYDWHDARVWEEAAMAGELTPLIEQLEQMNFIIVSGKSKRELPVSYTDFIEIPDVDCYLEKERIKRDVMNMCKKYPEPVFGFSVSMASNVIVDQLYDEVGNECWMIDFGSIWEPYIGQITRSYHHRYKTKELAT
ncbi:MAG: hypothetical protein CMB80_04835 [Flammeovirgaceae bacterium]|nr:hypothetical protein [Flammeovirgaceae bacterium]